MQVFVESTRKHSAVSQFEGDNSDNAAADSLLHVDPDTTQLVLVNALWKPDGPHGEPNQKTLAIAVEFLQQPPPSARASYLPQPRFHTHIHTHTHTHTRTLASTPDPRTPYARCFYDMSADRLFSSMHVCYWNRHTAVVCAYILLVR